MAEATLVMRLESGRSLDPAPAGSPPDPEGALLAAALATRGLRQVPLFSPPVLALSAQMRERFPKIAPDLSRYRRVLLPPTSPGLEAAAALFQTLAPLVRRVADAFYVSPAAVPPAPDTLLAGRTPHYEPWQGYLDPPEAGGVGARRAWRLPGGTGSGVQIADVEESWNPDHEDLPPVTRIGNLPADGWEAHDWKHGTAVLGVLGAPCDGQGMTGIAHGASLCFASVYDTPDGVGNESDAIGRAAVHLGEGDILLIEQQKRHPTLLDPDGVLAFLPVEWWPENFDVILTATLKGVIVVEPAGNSGVSLDQPELVKGLPGFPKGWKNPFAFEGPDSRAILVGAGNPPSQGIPGADEDAPARSRYAISNFGRRVDVQGWGIAVATCGGPADLKSAPEHRTYTREFGGTSAAAAIVAGVLASAQGMRRAAWPHGPFLQPLGARDLLRRTGQPQASSGGSTAVAEPIGNLPDLAALFP